MNSDNIDPASAEAGAPIIPLHRRETRDDASDDAPRRPLPEEGMAALSRLLDEAWVF